MMTNRRLVPLFLVATLVGCGGPGARLDDACGEAARQWEIAREAREEVWAILDEAYGRVQERLGRSLDRPRDRFAPLYVRWDQLDDEGFVRELRVARARAASACLRMGRAERRAARLLRWRRSLSARPLDGAFVGGEAALSLAGESAVDCVHRAATFRFRREDAAALYEWRIADRHYEALAASCVGGPFEPGPSAASLERFACDEAARELATARQERDLFSRLIAEEHAIDADTRFDGTGTLSDDLLEIWFRVESPETAARQRHVEAAATCERAREARDRALDLAYAFLGGVLFDMRGASLFCDQLVRWDGTATDLPVRILEWQRGDTLRERAILARCGVAEPVEHPPQRGPFVRSFRR